LPLEIASEDPRLLRGFTPWSPALVLDAFMREAMHQGLQIGVKILGPAQVILRSLEEYTDFRARSRRHAVSKRSSHRGAANSGESCMAQIG
jgi:hypothetical protein